MGQKKIQITYTYPGNGATKVFSVPWPFIDRRFVRVFLSHGSPDDTELFNKAEDITSTCRWLSDAQIEVSPAPTSGTVLILTRETPFDKTLATFKDGSVQLSDDLNLVGNQLLHIVQETKDFSQQVQDYVSGKYADQAALSANEAAASEVAAKTSEIKAADSAAAAALSANEAAASAIDSYSSAASSKADADRAAQLVDPASLASGVFNVRKAQVLTSGVSGQTVTLMGHYYPTRDVLYLAYNGTVLTPIKPGVEPTGDYSYEEVGADPNAESNKVKLHFATRAGDVLDMFVVASGAGRNIEQIAAMVAQAAASATTAGVSAQDAKDSADKAEDAAATLPDISQANAGDTIAVEPGPGGSLVARWQPPSAGAPPQRADTELNSPLAPGATFAVPQYTVGSKKLTVYLDGVLCSSGASGLYLEIGLAGSKSTSITLNNALGAGRELTAVVAG